MSPLHPSSKTASILKQTLLVWLVLMALAGGAQLSEVKCAFKGIFNFGDCNSDTGGFWAAFPAQSPPFGMTYFKKPVGRTTDGRLIIDFLDIVPTLLHWPPQCFYQILPYLSRELVHFL